MRSTQGNKWGLRNFSVWGVSAVLGIFLAGFGVTAQAVTIYVANGDADTSYIVDTDAGTFTSFGTTEADTGYAIAVRDTVILGGRDDGVAAEYALDGTPTGNTWVGDGNFSQMLDGTTDGANNYAAVWNSTGVIIADANWQGSQLLFDPGFSIIGITYDPTDNSLWVVSDDDTSIYQFALDGTQLGSFDAALPSRDCCLSYDPVNDSLWVGVNGSNSIYEFAKDGTQLGSVTIEGWNPGNIWGAEIAGATEVEPTALFNVTKTYTDGSTDSVEVTLTCNSGIPLQQSFTIEGGDPDGVTFVVTNIPEAGADCEVTESGGLDNYTPVLNGGDGCSWTGVNGGRYVCAIENQPNPAEYSVTTNWIVPDAGLEEPTDVEVTITCASEILTASVTPDSQSVNEIVVTLGDGETVDITVDTEAGSSSCTATQALSQSGVEPSASEACTSQVLDAGDSESCVFTNTVFFEGIPTLSQYGLAIMALLMLGVGMVGFRRFV